MRWKIARDDEGSIDEKLSPALLSTHNEERKNEARCA